MDDVMRRLAARPPTLAHVFVSRAAASADAVAFRYQVNGAWQESTWAQTRELVEPLAAGLLGLGVEPEDRVAIMSENRFEWILARLAATCAGAAVTTVRPSASPKDVAHVIDDSDAVVVFVDSLEQVAKLRAIRGDIRKVRKVVLFDDQHNDARVMTLEELLVSGEDVLAAAPGVVKERLSALRPEMLATILYTSEPAGSATDGTSTAVRARGVRHSHDAWTHHGAAIAEERVLGPHDLLVLSLPLSDPPAAVLLASQLACGFATAIVGDGQGDRLDDLAGLEPTFIAAGHRFLAEAPASEVRERLGGGRLRFVVSGAVASDTGVAESFERAGITLLQGYQPVESAAGVIVNRPQDNSFGSVGRGFAGTEVRIADDGEVMLRGPGVMLGYHKLAAETAIALRDGWLATGDIGRLDAAGRLTIIARKATRHGEVD